MRAVYRVGGMTCAHCVAAVTDAIERAAPGVKVAVDLAAGKVSVDGTLAADAVRRAVEGAGYRLDGV
jgi:copper chaperone